MEELKNIIAKNIVELRRSQNITQLELAEKLNYSSLYAFSKAFKNKYGMSPKHYLNNLKNNETLHYIISLQGTRPI